MNIFISSDDNYILATKVMLTSFLVNNPEERHKIYFMYGSVQEENLQALAQLVQGYQSNFIPVQLQESQFSGFKCSESFPILVYFRLLMPQFLPETEDRAMWMDVDLIVNGSLRDFYYQDFGESYIVACRDIGAQDRPVLFGHPAGTPYVNAGVMLYNLAPMRKYTLSDYYNYYLAHEAVIGYQDQDILNGMFAENIKVLDSVPYNVQVRFGSDSPQFRLRFLRKEAKIIHYLGHPKPWKNNCRLYCAAIWDDYYLMMLNKGNAYAFFYRIGHLCMCWYHRNILRPILVLRRMIGRNQK